MDNQPPAQWLSPQPVAPQTLPPSSQAPPRRSKLLIAVALLAIALLGAVGYGVYALHHKKAAGSLVATSSQPAQSKSQLKPTKPNGQATTQPATGSTASNANNAGAPCQTSQLSLDLDKTLDATAYRSGAFFQFTNTAAVTCTITGSPGFVAKTSSGQTITSDQGSSYLIDDPGSQTVTLAPGDVAYFGVGWQELNTDGSLNGCVTSTTAAAIPPDNTTPLTTAASLANVCSDVSVTAVGPASAFTVSSP